jgi:hypothetical protein
MAKLNATLSFDLDTYAGVDNETLVIDARTREIYIPDPENVFGVQYDKDSKYVKFKVVNEVSEVFKMEDALIRINYRDSKGIIGSSLAVDKVTDYDKCEFSWIVPNNALKNKGDLYFVVSAVVVDEDGIIQKRWSTTLSRVVTPESIYSKSASLDQNERDEIAMLLLLVSEKCNQAIEDIGEARDTGVTTITNIKDSGIEELNDLISKYGIRFEDLNVLKSRIDQLFDSGNLPGSNTEVTDIRIGYDGKTYSTAGNAVRIQISNIMEMILDNNFYTPLLIDRDFELIDEENNTLQADWKYKVDGNQDLNCDNGNMGDSGDIAYELESLRNQIKFELKQIKAETSGLKEDLVFNQKEDAKTKRSLSALWDLNKGISYRFETDSEKAYKKQIPSGAKLASINKVGGQIIKQDDALIVAGVNDVDIIGKNIFESKGFSCSGIQNANKLSLDNVTGTSINSTSPSNKVTVTQSKVGQVDNITSYYNGYFCLAIKPFILNKESVFSFDVIPSNKLISNPKIIIILNGNNSINVGYTQDLQIGKRCKLYFNLEANSKELRYIEIRNSGISGIFENFQIEEGSINTDFSPYAKKSYKIPQSIQNIDGYGWSAGTAYNYVDFENKKYYKCIGRYVVTGDEIFQTNQMYIGDNSSNAYILMDIGQKKSADTKLISNKLQYLNQCWSIDSAYDAMCFYETQIHIRILNSSLGITKGTSLSEIKNAMKKYCKSLYESGNPIIIYYELAEEEIIDISDIIGDTFQESFEVENGGSLTFKNTNGDGYQIAVPSDIQYVVSLSEVNS